MTAFWGAIGDGLLLTDSEEDEEGLEDDVNEDDDGDGNLDTLEGDRIADSFCNLQVVSWSGANGLTTKLKLADEQSTSSRHHPRHSYRLTFLMV